MAGLIDGERGLADRAGLGTDPARRPPKGDAAFRMQLQRAEPVAAQPRAGRVSAGVGQAAAQGMVGQATHGSVVGSRKGVPAASPPSARTLTSA